MTSARAAAAAPRLPPGQPRRGKAPKPIEARPADKAPRHVTAPELPIMPTPNKGWDDCGKAPARVDATCQIIVACAVTAASNDTQPAEPMGQATLLSLSQAGLAPGSDDPGTAPAIVATLESGYDRAAAVVARETLGCAPSMATGRQRHHDPEAPVLEESTNAKARMSATVRTPAGTALYARRKGIVAPVCGQSKEARGFRRLLLGGLENLRGEWRLGCLTHNLRKMWRSGWVGTALETV